MVKIIGTSFFLKEKWKENQLYTKNHYTCVPKCETLYYCTLTFECDHSSKDGNYCKKTFTIFDNISCIRKCKATVNKYYLSNLFLFAKCPGNNEDTHNKDNDNEKNVLTNVIYTLIKIFKILIRICWIMWKIFYW